MLFLTKDHKVFHNGKWITIAELLFLYGKHVGDGFVKISLEQMNYYKSTSINKRRVKEYNSDGRNKCIVCGKEIVEPYPNIRYCPECE